MYKHGSRKKKSNNLRIKYKTSGLCFDDLIAPHSCEDLFHISLVHDAMHNK